MDEQEIKERFKKLIGGQQRYVNWVQLFSEWLTYDKTIAQFCKEKSIHKGSIQKRGGRKFWNAAREEVRRKALANAIEHAPTTMEQKYAKQLRITSKAEDLIEKQLDFLSKDGNNLSPLARISLEEKIEILARSIKNLSETNKSLRGDDVQKHEVKSVSLYSTILQVIDERDKKFGIPS